MLILIILLAAGTASADLRESLEKDIAALRRRVTQENLRELTAKAMGTDMQDAALQAVEQAFRQQLGHATPARLNARRLRLLSETADAFLLLAKARQATDRTQAFLDRQFKRWLLLSNHRRTDFLNYLNLSKDDFSQVMDIMRRLWQHDPQNAQSTWPLILAMALVWDTPRPPLHDQIGPAMIPFTPDLNRRYDFFKRTLTDAQAHFTMGQLSIPALCFIVDTPVPVSELEWAQKHVRLKAPQEIFASVAYDSRRLQRAATSIQFAPDRQPGAGKASLYWPYPCYSMESIRLHGGICTDQAYFTTLALRARGIPAILLQGMGRRGGHAWVAYMKSPRQWKTDVGRPRQDSYTTGNARHPQTGMPFNDHVITLICQRLTLANDTQRTKANNLTRLAFTLQVMGMDQNAKTVAEMAVQADARNLHAWDILAQTQTSQEELIAVLESQERHFKNYPDMVTDFRLKQARILRERGWKKQAEQILQHMPQNARRRDDLTREVAFEQIRDANRDGETTKARLILERYLKAQKKEAAKTLNDLQVYLTLTKDTEQTQEAVDFLKPYLHALAKSFDRHAEKDPIYQNWDKLILIQAYENNGDLKRAQRLRKKLDD